MPSLTFPATISRLAVPVWVGLDRTNAQQRQATGQGALRPVQARGELDTATYPTAIASWVLQRLGLKPVGSVSMQTAAGQHTVRLFDVSLSITDLTTPGAPMLTIAQLRASELVTPLPDTDVLIGLDVLLQVRFHLDGPARTFTLEF